MEKEQIPFKYYVLTFFSVVFCRLFIETFSDKYPPNFIAHLHYILFYLTLTFSLTLVISSLISTKPSQVLRFILGNIPVILLAPLIDLIITSGKGMNMAYLLPEVHHGLVFRFFTLGGKPEPMGITWGIKVEVILIVLGTILYACYKQSTFVRSCIVGFCVYGLLYLFAIYPFLMKAVVGFLGGEYRYSSGLMISGYMMVLPFLTMVLLYLQNSKFFNGFAKEFSFLRLNYYYLMILLGVLLTGKSLASFIYPPIKMFSLVIIFWAVLMAALGVTVINNLRDVKIDKITNPHRLLVRGEIDPKIYGKIGLFSLGLGMFYAWAVHYVLFFLLALMVGLYMIYSVEPLRLKRIFPLSKLIIAFNSVLAMLMGYVFAGGMWREIPLASLFFCFAGIALVVNFVDFKDFEGDTAGGIKTLSTLIGLRRAKILTALFFPLTNMLFLRAFGLLQYWYFGLAASAIESVLLLRKKFDEKLLFVAIELSIIGLFILFSMT